MPTYSLAAGSYDGRVRVYDLRMGRATVDRLAQAVGSVRCSRDGNAVLVSSLDSRVRVLDRQDGKLLKAFGGEDAVSDGAAAGNGNDGGMYRNTELRIRSVFAKGDAVVLSGSEAAKDRGGPARMFAWDVLSGEVVASVPAGEGVKAVSCVGWNEKEGCWAGGCSDGMFELIELLRVDGRLWLMDWLCRVCQGVWLSGRRQLFCLPVIVTRWASCLWGDGFKCPAWITGSGLLNPKMSCFVSSA
jgi:WD40 repeat protein